MTQRGIDYSPPPESQKGGGVGEWLRTTVRSLLGRQQTKEVTPPWSMQISGMVDRNRPIQVTIQRIPGERGFRVECSEGFVSKNMLVDSVETADHIEQVLPALDSATLSVLAGELGFTELDDSRIEHPEGAASYMKDAVMKAIKRKN